MDAFDFIEIKNVYTLKDTVIKIKRQTTHL